MPLLELGDELIERDAAQGEQHEQVENEVRCLGRHALARFRDGGQCKLDAFLADLLRNLGDASGRESRGVTVIGSRSAIMVSSVSRNSVLATIVSGQAGVRLGV